MIKTNMGSGSGGSLEGGNRILFLTNHSPYPPPNGPKLRNWALIRALVANGYQIDLLCLADKAEPILPEDSIHEVCRSVEVIRMDWSSLSRGADILPRLYPMMRRLPYGVERCRSNEMKGRILSRLEQGQVDAVICGETYVLANVPSALSVPLIVDHHNAEHVILNRYMQYERNPAKRAYAALEAGNLRRWEQSATGRANLAFVCSEADRRIYSELSPGVPVAVVPNAIDTDAYAPLTYEDPNLVLYTGGMDWYPNRDAVEHFVFRILPQVRELAPGVKFLVAGRNPSPAFLKRFSGIPGVEFTGTVADMQPHIARAAVSVVPLRIGSGTRLKILEAAAMGKPIVSTSVGAEGLELTNGQDFIREDDPESFARAVGTLLGDAALRRRLGQAARRVVERHYSLAALRVAVHTALESLPTPNGEAVSASGHNGLRP